MLTRKIFPLEINYGRVKFAAGNTRDDPRPQGSGLSPADDRNPIQQVDNRLLVIGPVLALSSAGAGMSSDSRANGHKRPPASLIFTSMARRQKGVRIVCV
jgi:hypothetical protein